MAAYTKTIIILSSFINNMGGFHITSFHIFGISFLKNQFISAVIFTSLVLPVCKP